MADKLADDKNSYNNLRTIVTLLPYLVGMSGLFYLFGAVLLGAGFLYYTVLMHFNHDDRIAMQTFSYSVIYLMLLFAFLLVDHYIPLIASNLLEININLIFY